MLMLAKSVKIFSVILRTRYADPTVPFAVRKQIAPNVL